MLVGIGLIVGPVTVSGAQPPSASPIAGSASPFAGRIKSLSPVPAATALDFEVVLNPRDASGAQALALAVSTPGSASYHQFLTPRQWEARFSPTRGEVAQVTRWLRGQGLKVRSVSPDRLAVEVTGTSAGVEQAFDTTLAYHVMNGGRLRLAETDLSVPSTLSGIVAGTLGVNQSPSVPRNAVDAPGPAARARVTARSRRIKPPPGAQTPPSCGAFYGQAFNTTSPAYGHGYPQPLPDVVCGYTPVQMRQAYDVANLVAIGDTGSGQTVAVIDAYASPTLLSDAQTYAQINDPTHPLASSQFSEKVTRSASDKGTCDASGWYGEQALDVEAVHAMAPGAHILYVGAQNCLQGLYDRLRLVVDHHLAGVVSASWGDNGGDLLDDAGTRTAVDDTLMMAAGTGISVLFASGDNGDEFATVGTAAADYPASSPWATAVGGTTLESGFGVGELGWSTANSYLCTEVVVGLQGCSSATLNTWLPATFNLGSGGGTSFHYPQPAYQVGVVPNTMSQRNAAIVGPTPMRVEPDVAMDADPGTGMLEGVTQTFPNGVRYGQYRVGGTSLSTPMFAGLVALSDQLAGRSLGFLDPELYALHTSQPSVLYDVLPGGNKAQSEVDYANSVDASGGLVSTTRIDGYQGAETYCPPTGSCVTGHVVLTTARGYDDMTGLGAPRTGLVPALAKL